MFKRSLSVTLFAWMVFLIAISNLTRFIQAILQWDFLLQYLSVSPLYLILTGLMWGSVFLLSFLGLWIGLQWVKIAIKYIIRVYIIYFWIDRFFIGNSICREANQYFMGMATVFLMIWTYWVFSHGYVKRVVGDNN